MTIFIATRGRAGRSKTISQLIECKLRATLFIEKEQEQAYRAEYGSKVDYFVLKLSNQGLMYVRQVILENMTGPTWVLDDDITAFYIRQGTKMVKSTADKVLQLAEQDFISNNATQGSLGYQQIEWSSTKNFHTDAYCDVAVWIKRVSGINFTPGMDGKGDRDFTMQIIAAGFIAMRHSIYCFAAPANGSNEGGLKDIFYDLKGREEKDTDDLVKKWPWCVEKITKPNGRIDAKIDWKKINLKQDTLFNF